MTRAAYAGGPIVPKLDGASLVWYKVASYRWGPWGVRVANGVKQRIKARSTWKEKR
jgi:hypothetical protein